MPRYLIRVELRKIKNLEDDAYDKLHETMELEHCYRSLTWDGKKYRLPDDTYCTADEAASVKSIGQKVSRAASKVDKEFGYIVVPLGDAADFNLPPVDDGEQPRRYVPGGK
jgi:ethanolamine utilization microcompartment shell protein EutL